MLPITDIQKSYMGSPILHELYKIPERITSALWISTSEESNCSTQIAEYPLPEAQLNYPLPEARLNIQRLENLPPHALIFFFFFGNNFSFVKHQIIVLKNLSTTCYTQKVL